MTNGMTPAKGFDQTCLASMLIRRDGGKMNQKTWYMTSRTLDSEGTVKGEEKQRLCLPWGWEIQQEWRFLRLESKDADGFWGEALDGDC